MFGNFGWSILFHQHPARSWLKMFFFPENFFFFPIVLIIFILVLTIRTIFNLLTWSLLDEVESINLNSKLYGRQKCYYEFSESPPFLRLSWVCQVSHLFPIVASNVPFHWRYSPSRVLTLMESTCLLCEAQNFASCPKMVVKTWHFRVWRLLNSHRKAVTPRKRFVITSLAAALYLVLEDFLYYLISM